MVGLEVDADHGAQFEVDEQQEDVIDRDVPLLHHPQEGHHRSPGRDASNGEQRQVVEALHQQVSQRFGQAMHVFAQRFSPVDLHDKAPWYDGPDGAGRK
ncbi:hypothetical protein D3C72_2182800 [compost metagenome]